jgi:hypothetical protein
MVLDDKFGFVDFDANSTLLLGVLPDSPPATIRSDQHLHSIMAFSDQTYVLYTDLRGYGQLVDIKGKIRENVPVGPREGTLARPRRVQLELSAGSSVTFATLQIVPSASVDRFSDRSAWYSGSVPASLRMRTRWRKTA